MSSNLYPLVLKPGIKRDGTKFQGDYCTSGQWVRFQRGFIKKMGGMKGLSLVNNNDPNPNITNITIIPLDGNNNMGVYIGYILGNDNAHKIRYAVINQNFEIIQDFIDLTSNQLPNMTCHTTTIIQNNSRKIVFLGAPDKLAINTNANSFLSACTIPTVAVPFTNLPPVLAGLSGMLFTNPYLFVYGSNGLVQWSKATDPLNFSGAGQSITISNDKVIYGAAIRGGINTPTILFWTLTSVVRCINTGANALAFQLDVLSKSSSILSSRCVVEYDGVFYWPGTNRFYHYNGLVQELANTLSLNYFFDNIDMELRQQVVGVKNTKYGEIWWFYPEKQGAPSRNPLIPAGRNSRALIYNIRESAWYDTEISRSAAFYSEDFGFMSTVGGQLTLPQSNQVYAWRHEYETFSSNPTAINEHPGNFSVPITSSFVTPTISWAAFNPMKQLTGVNRWMKVETLEPDFNLLPAGGTDMEVRVLTKQYAQDYPITSAPYNIPGISQQGDNPNQAKVDIAVQGRHISFSFVTTCNFEMGQVMLSLGIGDGQ